MVTGVGGTAGGFAAEGGNAAGVNDALDSGLGRRAQQRPGATDIRIVELLGVFHPQAVVGGCVVKSSAALHGISHGLRIVEVTLRQLHIQAVDIAPVTFAPHQHTDRLAPVQQGPGDGGSKKSGGACNQRSHRFSR